MSCLLYRLIGMIGIIVAKYWSWRSSLLGMNEINNKYRKKFMNGQQEKHQRLSRMDSILVSNWSTPISL